MRIVRSLAPCAGALAFAAAACSANFEPGQDSAFAPSPDIAAQTAAAGPSIDQPPAADPAPAAPDAGAPPPGTAPPPAAPPVPAPPSTDPPASHIPLKYLIGDVDPATDPRFTRIPDKYLGGSRVWGHKDAVAAFVRMAEEAERNGYRLKIVSAFRSFSDQKKIWEDKWSGKTLVGGKKLNISIPDPVARARKILEFSSMPGTSRHHWGSDFDINALDNRYFATRDGARLYDWLVANAANFGFCQVYSAKGEGGRASGYEEEKWHWSYRPIADWYLKQYPVDVGYERLTGFLGAETARTIDVIPNYVDAINPECRN